jgi:hypothetical protein
MRWETLCDFSHPHRALISPSLLTHSPNHDSTQWLQGGKFLQVLMRKLFHVQRTEYAWLQYFGIPSLAYQLQKFVNRWMTNPALDTMFETELETESKKQE